MKVCFETGDIAKIVEDLGKEEISSVIEAMKMRASSA
jgi:hypothetical protein